MVPPGRQCGVKPERSKACAYAGISLHNCVQLTQCSLGVLASYGRPCSSLPPFVSGDIGGNVFARIARFEGGDPARLGEAIEGVRARVESGSESPPEGLEGAKEVWMLVDRQTGTGLGITLFESEEEMRRGDEALNAMSPPVPEASGSRTGVELYEVALRHVRS
jgi:hypothetical protein